MQQPELFDSEPYKTHRWRVEWCHTGDDTEIVGSFDKYEHALDFTRAYYNVLEVDENWSDSFSLYYPISAFVWLDEQGGPMIHIYYEENK